MAGVETGRVQKAFSRQTLEKFEAASASIVLRDLDRAFQGAEIPLGKDRGGPEGTRRAQFRRYVSTVDQLDPQQRDRLGEALGALIAVVADSKVEFLVRAAESDGFAFAEGAFRPAAAGMSAFAVTRAEDLANIDDRGRRLHRFADDSPGDAIGGAIELVESTCRTVLRLLGEPAPRKKADLGDITEATLSALERVRPAGDEAKKGEDVVRRSLQQIGAVVASLGELRIVSSSGRARGGRLKGLLPRHARLAAGAAVTFAGFVAQAYAEQAVPGAARTS